MTPLLLFLYALAVAGGLLVIGATAVCLFGTVCWLLGGSSRARRVDASVETTTGEPAKTGVGITGHREP